MKYTITFKPSDVSIRVDKGTNLLDAALAAGVHINASCGGQGVCGKCRVILETGDVESQENENITAEEFNEGWRLACSTSVVSDCLIQIPPESRGAEGFVAQKLDMGKAERTVSELEPIPLAADWKLDPIVTKVPLRLNKPSFGENISDLSRFLSGLKKQHGIEAVSTEMRCLRVLPKILRDNDWSVTATVMSDPAQELGLLPSEKKGLPRLVRVEGGDTSDKNLALALDVGTTTVSAQLVDLNTGKVGADKSVYNNQIKYGDDVITRIVFAQKGDGLKKLQTAVVASINQLIDKLLEESGNSKENISCICAAGNTTMTHLLLGVEPRYIREAPYVPAAGFMPLERAADIGIDLPDGVRLYTFPSVASYVGGDIVSGIFGAGISQGEELTLYIDIGTNGEIVLGNKELLACAACSMGPAFEGGGIRHGMRADIGAIEGFHINPITLEPMVVTMGKSRPRGICGSGLISILAELLSAGVIDQNGKFEQKLSSKRVRSGGSGGEYVLVWAEDSATGQDIVIAEVDIENLVRAKGALFAGCQTLLSSLSFSFEDIEKIVIAGAFGHYINLEKGKLIGLFPDLPVEKFHFIGNGSIMGARLACLYKGMLNEVERVAKMMTNVELSDNQSFMDKYMAALFLPHTESRFFYNVSKYLEKSRQVAQMEREAQ